MTNTVANALRSGGSFSKKLFFLKTSRLFKLKRVVTLPVEKASLQCRRMMSIFFNHSDLSILNWLASNLQ